MGKAACRPGSSDMTRISKASDPGIIPHIGCVTADDRSSDRPHLGRTVGCRHLQVCTEPFSKRSGSALGCLTSWERLIAMDGDGGDAMSSCESWRESSWRFGLVYFVLEDEGDSRPGCGHKEIH